MVDGRSSAPAPVTSGVPQGSVLGPILFLIYIHDLPDSVKSHVRLFADDTIIYNHIKVKKDQLQLKSDLQKLEAWEGKWLMEFHPGKCQVINFTRSPKLIHKYTLHDHQLDAVSSAKYLGLTLSKDMTWKTHVSQVITKANRSLGFLIRNLQIRSPDIKEKAYFGLVRPQVEYASSVWDPYHKNQVHSIEMVQRRTARWVLNRYHNTSSVTDMLQHLGWQTLQQRRQNARLVNLIKCLADWLPSVHPNIQLPSTGPPDTIISIAHPTPSSV